MPRTTRDQVAVLKRREVLTASLRRWYHGVHRSYTGRRDHGSGRGAESQRYNHKRPRKCKIGLQMRRLLLTPFLVILLVLVACSGSTPTPEVAETPAPTQAAALASTETPAGGPTAAPRLTPAKTSTVEPVETPEPAPMTEPIKAVPAPVPISIILALTQTLEPSSQAPTAKRKENP